MDEKVLDEDKTMFKKRIHSELYNYFEFSRNIVSTKEFKVQFNKDKSYIKNESMFLLNSPSTFLYGIRMVYFPLAFRILKNWGRSIMLTCKIKDD